MLNWTSPLGSSGKSVLVGKQEIPNETPAPTPVGIALALGGGAARGWAHIGVLKAFDEAEIPINMIAGTSIGALVGGCYLAGKLPELEEFALSLTKRRIFGLLDFNFSGSGLLAGMRLTSRMREHLEGMTVESLPKPLVCVATEVRTGHEVWIHQGSLITAIRASYALPGVFSPVVCNGRVLVDGALVNPVPVSVCRAYEQRVVVAVNLSSMALGRAAVIRHSAGLVEAADSDVGPSRPPLEFVRGPDLPSKPIGLLGVMIESFNIMQDRISRGRLAGDPPDLTLPLKLGNLGLAEFHRAAEAIELGYQAGKLQAPEIKETLSLLT